MLPEDYFLYRIKPLSSSEPFVTCLLNCGVGREAAGDIYMARRIMAFAVCIFVNSGSSDKVIAMVVAIRDKDNPDTCRNISCEDLRVFVH